MSKINKVFITGGYGLLGTALVNFFLIKKIKVVILDLKKPNYRKKFFFTDKNLIIETGDLINIKTVQKIFVKQFYRFYTHSVMPFIGWFFSKDKSAYQYLSDSANSFPFGEAFNNILKKIGFIGVEDIPQTLGVASIYRAKKPKL